MKTKQAIAGLGALAQETRLAAFRLLVQAGPEGMPAGEIAEKLNLAPSSLSFHLAQLTQAGMVVQLRSGRSLIYSIDFQSMNGLMAYLTENCCGGNNSACTSVCEPATRSVKSRRIA
jgi:ArsR family transcriptional regulator, arsenate/arsenite/antimonite-responsive transcriptional repressor